ncbi:MAG: hypothetical protein MMC23_000198 [Stictis urceolatum]|nr:hypothetical protein [Stictis urceolata]
MEARSGATPMDFQYENGYGDRPLTSPFPQADPNGPRGFAYDPQKSPLRNVPRFGAPAYNHLPRTPSKPAPNWREQDHEAESTDCGQSPENDAGDEGTPDSRLPEVRPLAVRELGNKIQVARGTSKVARPKRDSLLGGMRAKAEHLTQNFFFSPSSRSFRSGDLTTLHGRSRKRSRREYSQDDLSDWDDSRPSSSDGAQKKQAALPPREIGIIPSILSFIHQHPNLPNILTHWARMIVACGFMALLFYAVHLMWSMLKHDIEIEVQKAANEVIRENAACFHDYTANRCGPDADTPPALRDQCHRWRDCYNRDPMAIGRSSITAATIAKLLNDTFDRLSWKFISMITFMGFILFVTPYYIFGVFLSKHAPPPPAYPPPPQFPAAPYMQSPYHQAQQHEEFFTPRHQRLGDGYEPEMSPSRRGRESPTRRLVYRD